MRWKNVRKASLISSLGGWPLTPAAFPAACPSLLYSFFDGSCLCVTPYFET